MRSRMRPGVPTMISDPNDDDDDNNNNDDGG